MPRTRPLTSGYARIAQAEEDENEEQSAFFEDSDDEELNARYKQSSHSRYAPNTSHRYSSLQVPGSKYDTAAAPDHGRKPRRGFRRRTNSAVDIKAINARLEKWAEEIAQKFKIRKHRGKHEQDEKLEIQHSVFQPPDDIRPATADSLAARFSVEPGGDRMSKAQFDEVVESVKVAIELGVHPRLITQGSSGSYFARNGEGKVVGVFKPKDEEPYASKNPKWTKWIHRNLFPFFFGRACLIPNLSYVSEAAAHVLDSRLQTNIVPYTDIVRLSSISFNYDFWDRRAYYRKRKQLPEKVGSFQAFLKGYKDANIFLKQHPWPDQLTSDLEDGTNARTKKKKRRRRWAEDCRPGRSSLSDDDEDDEDDEGNDDAAAAEGEEQQQAQRANGRSSRSQSRPHSRNESERRREFWTPALRQSFREQLEKLVILDYIMRNTDRGLDNWMIKIDRDAEEVSVVADVPHDTTTTTTNNMSEPYKRESPMSMHGPPTPAPAAESFKVSIGAIDNSLSWPWKHPDAWRSFPFGWLFLPVSLIGQPFSENTRQHFLPLLTSKQWWSETQAALRQCFKQDSDFQEKMYSRQMAVMKGQAWNVVETLKTKDHGPLELTRRTRVCVWDDLVDVPVVIPLRPPSEEMQRQREVAEQAASVAAAAAAMEHDEMDISSALHASSNHHHSLPNPNKFTLSPPPEREAVTDYHSQQQQGRRPSAELPGRYSFDLSKPQSNSNSSRTAAAVDGLSFPSSSSSKPRPFQQKRVSLDQPRASWHPHYHHHYNSGSAESASWSLSASSRRRNYSFTGYSRPSDLTVDDLEGDLGYAAAQDMDANKKKVIVERIETVKSRNPVFTWC